MCFKGHNIGICDGNSACLLHNKNETALGNNPTIAAMDDKTFQVGLNENDSRFELLLSNRVIAIISYGQIFSGGGYM